MIIQLKRNNFGKTNLLTNIQKERKSANNVLINRTNLDILRGNDNKGASNLTKYDAFIKLAKSRMKNQEDSNTEVIKFYRSGSRDSKEEITGLNSTTNMSNILKDNNTSRNIYIAQNMDDSVSNSDEEPHQKDPSKMDKINLKKLKELGVSYLNFLKFYRINTNV